jgi:Zn-dependent M28 family amino/carboxypeptidase
MKAYQIILAMSIGIGMIDRSALAQSAGNIGVHVKFLSADLLEGRGPGTRGGELATEYMAAQLALAGARPGGENGTFFQKVPLIGVETAPGAVLSVGGGSGTASFKWLDDFVGGSQAQRPATKFDAEAVFVGHGITAPEYGWDDYKDMDVRGKVVVLFTNEPPSTDPKFFDGRALTYYGRWTYKFEQATRRGAVAAIIIHTDETAGYGWDVVRNSWGREEPYVKLTAGEPALAMAGWITREAGGRLLGLSGRKVEEMLTAGRSRDFRPVPLGLRVRAAFTSKIREIDTRNVAAVIPGSDPKLASEYVLFTAHWDHLGVGLPVNGDAIYNGAVDNATGCGVLLELARAWSQLTPKPRRSAIFLAVTAEEGGLRGSQYYATNPLFPPEKTAVNLNYDALYPFGRTNDVLVLGAERTSLRNLLQAVAERQRLLMQQDPRPEQGSYFRSDHFPLARVGIPAVSIKLGNDIIGKPQGHGDRAFAEYNTKHYHQPSDEYRADWDLSGVEQMARFGLAVGIEVANQEKLPPRMKLGAGGQ